MADFDWQGFIFDAQAGWLERLQARARRRFRHDDAFAEEALTYALEKLSDNDWERLRSFSNGSQPGTFLMAVYNRLLEDVHRKRFGRPRPPAWLEGMGAAWVRVWDLLCRRRFEPETVVDRLCARDEHEPGRVRDMMRVIRARIPGCGQPSGEQSYAEVPEPPPETRAPFHAPEHASDHGRREGLLLALSALLANPAPARVPEARQAERAAAVAQKIDETTVALGRDMNISDAERLLLRLRYEEGRPVARIARDLDRPEHQVRRELKAVLARIVKALAAQGITRDTLAGLLED